MPQFYKYQGTGNDFILIDDRNLSFDTQNQAFIQQLCHRRFGIGADGLMLLQKPKQVNTAFYMVYCNADGRQSSMCGNGGRCIVAFAHFLGLIGQTTTFEAIDGIHEAKIQDGLISLKMNEVREIKSILNGFFLNTGSPHYVEFVPTAKDVEVYAKGKAIRHHAHFQPEGTNANFVEIITKDHIFVRTFERGVEDETYSCGTGVTAAAIVHAHKHSLHTTHSITIHTLGGNLVVDFEKIDNTYQQVFLTGKAEQVFSGVI
jgi:diaminopimelate epimerase